MVPTHEMAEDLARLGFERLRVVGRGVNAKTFSPERRQRGLRAQWGADERTPVALCVSRFAPEKNFPLVLEAYAAMRRANPDVKLVLVGDGPLQAELQRANTGSVIAGRLVNGELSAHYASADIFLFPSVTETFGNVTLEAMASGLAVVAYRYAAARQHLEHGRSALLAETGDRAGFIAQAERLARDPELVRSLGRAARAAAEPISWERITRDFEAVLAEVASLQGEAAHAAA
jgi:glycosyltransferase involved in cell wall biosynthesis